MKKRSGEEVGTLDALFFFGGFFDKSWRIPCPDSVQMSVQQTLRSERADALNALIKSAAATHVFLLVARAHEPARGGALIQSAALPG